MIENNFLLRLKSFYFHQPRSSLFYKYVDNKLTSDQTEYLHIKMYPCKIILP